MLCFKHNIFQLSVNKTRVVKHIKYRDWLNNNELLYCVASLASHKMDIVVILNERHIYIDFKSLFVVGHCTKRILVEFGRT